MRRLTLESYQLLLDSSQVIERDGHGPKVLSLADGSLVKIFRRKHRLSTAAFLPYAVRFARNVRRLTSRGILTVEVTDLAHCPAVTRHLVTYRPLPGRTLRQALAAPGAERDGLFDAFARLVATLHQKGIYFRSLHFGNVIVTPDGDRLGLIDMADLTIFPWSLWPLQRTGNFRHMLRYREDRTALQAFGWERFVDAYLEAAGLTDARAAVVRRRLLAAGPALFANS